MQLAQFASYSRFNLDLFAKSSFELLHYRMIGMNIYVKHREKREQLNQNENLSNIDFLYLLIHFFIFFIYFHYESLSSRIITLHFSFYL